MLVILALKARQRNRRVKYEWLRVVENQQKSVSQSRG